MSQRVSQLAFKKDPKTSLGKTSDEILPEQSADEDEEEETEEDEDLTHPDPEKKRLAEITDSHLKIIALCRKTRDDGKKKTRPSFTKGGKTLEDFMSKYKDVLDASGDNNKTLLHHLARSLTRSLLPMLRWLLKTYPHLILQADYEDHTALYTAIASQNASFVDEVCEHSDKKVDALQQTGVDGTCLHKALELQSSTVSNMNVVHRVISVLDKTQDGQGQADSKGSTPLRNVLSKRDKEGNTPLHIALTTVARCSARMDQGTSANFTSSEAQLGSLIDLAIVLVKERPDTMYERNEKEKSPYDCLGPAKELGACENLLEEMKKGIMRKLSHDDVINVLYADSGTELSIFFDITQFAGRIIPVTELDGWGKHIRFEKILQHVDLPSLTISGGDDLLNNSSSDSEANSSFYTLKGRIDFVKFFYWLRSKGGVRKVLEANVEDDEIEPHCDEAIEKALEGLDVEILDWKKLDLCSDVLWNAARDVKELYLYSSANNDVLRSWSAKDGLARLPKLKKVHLSIREGYTTAMRIAGYMTEFRTRLEKNCPRVVLDEGKAWRNKRANESSSHRDFGTTPKHPWLDCMYNFAMTVRNNHRHFKNLASEVRVAIIDDGIDDSLAIFRERIAGGKSFLKRPDRPDRTIDYWVRPGGHGTQMAKLICQIFPYARLYIIRLDEGVGEKEERQIKIDSAIKAVDWAIKNSVDIISMSWSIHKTDVHSQKIDELETSIKAAYDKGITMFCAASDHGRNIESAAEEDLPAAFIYPIKIGAAKADGNAWAQTGLEQVDFYLPGHKIALDGYQPAKGQPQSGSSLATAVAAGLAALLQYCNSIASDDRTPNALKTTGTRQAFKQLCTSQSKFPEVEKHFGSTRNLDRPNEVKEKYRGIAVDLQMSKI